MNSVTRTLDVLRAYYADREGNPHPLNDVQLTVYLDALSACEPAKVEAAARQWMRQSKWFPKVSDLLELIQPLNAESAALLAWSAVERAVQQVGAYQAVQFADAAIGETVRVVFGSWPRACSFDYDSPGWHERKQAFLRLYASIAARQPDSPILAGMHGRSQPALIGHVEGLPLLPARQEAALTAGESKALLASIRERVTGVAPYRLDR